MTLPKPTTTFEVAGAEAALGGSVATGSRAPGGKALSVQFGGEAAAKVGVEVNHENGRKTTWVELNGKAALDVLAVDNLHREDGTSREAGELGGQAMGLLTHDRDGELIEVEVRMMVSGGQLDEERPDLAVLLDARGQLTDPRTMTVPRPGGDDPSLQPEDLLQLGIDRWKTHDLTQTLTIPLDNAADRRIVEDWADGSPTPFASDAVRDLGDTKGIHTLVREHGTGARSGAGIRTEKGGLVISGQTSERRPVDVLHLGPPQASGRREWQPTTGCGASAGG